MAKIKKLKTKDVAKKVKELNIFKEARERDGFHFPKLFKTINPKIDEKSVTEFIEGIDTIFENNPVDVYAVAEFDRGNSFETTEEATRSLFAHLDKKQVRHMFDILNKTNYLNQVEKSLSVTAVAPEVIEKIHTAKDRYHSTLTTLFTDISLTAEAQERSTKFDEQVEKLGINNPDRELVRAFSFIGVEIKFEDGKWVYDTDNTARNNRGIKFGNGEYFKLPESSVKVFLENYLNKSPSTRGGIVNPKGLFDLYLETAKDSIATKSLTAEDRLITDKQFEMFREDFATDSSNWLAFKSGAVSITEEAAHIALATYHKKMLTSDRFKGFSENKGKIWGEVAWAEIEKNDRIDARAIERIQEYTERQFEQFDAVFNHLDQVKQKSEENYNTAIATLQSELSLATSEEAKKELSEKIEELENRRDAVNLTVDFQMEYIERAVAGDEIDGKPVDLDEVIQDAMSYEITKDANGQISVSVTDESHSIEDVQDIIDNLSTKQIEEVVEGVEEESETEETITSPTAEELVINKDVVPNVLGYLMGFQDEKGEYKYGNALEQAALLDRTTYFFTSDAYLGKAYETFKEQNPDMENVHIAFIDYLEEQGFFKENENNENFLFTKETLTATLKDIETGDSTDFNNLIDSSMTIPCLMADAITQAIENTPGMREKFETMSHEERQSTVNDYVRQIEASTDLGAITDPDQINNAIRRWFPTYEIISDNAHMKDLADVDVNDGSMQANIKKTLIDHLMDTHKSRHDMNEALKSENQKTVDTDLKYLTPEAEAEQEIEDEIDEPENEDELEEEQEKQPVEEKEYDPEKFIKKLKPYNLKAGKKFLEGLEKALDKFIKEKELEETSFVQQSPVPPEKKIVGETINIIGTPPQRPEIKEVTESEENLEEEVEEVEEETINEPPTTNLDGNQLINQAIIKMFNDINPKDLGFDNPEYQSAFDLMKKVVNGELFFANVPYSQTQEIKSNEEGHNYQFNNVTEYFQALLYNVLTSPNPEQIYYNSDNKNGSLNTNLHKFGYDKSRHNDLIKNRLNYNFGKIAKTIEIFQAASPAVFSALQGMTMDNLTPEAMEALQAYIGKENVIDNENDNSNISKTITQTIDETTPETIEKQPLVTEEINNQTGVVSAFTEAEIREDLHWHIVHKSLQDTFDQLGQISANDPKMQSYLQDVNEIMNDFMLENSTKEVRQRADGMGASSLIVPCPDGKHSYNCNTVTGYIQSLLYLTSTGAELPKLSPEQEATYRDIVDKTMGTPGYFDKIQKTVKVFEGCSLPLVTAEVSNSSDVSFTSAITTEIVGIIKSEMQSGKPLNEVINGNAQVIELISDMTETLNTEGLTDTILTNIKYELQAEKFSAMDDKELSDYASFVFNEEMSQRSGIVSGSLEVGPLSRDIQTAAVAAIESYKRNPNALDGKFKFNDVEIDISSINNPRDIVEQYLKELDNMKLNADKQSNGEQPVTEGKVEEEKPFNVYEYILNSANGETIKTAVALQRITIMKQLTDATSLKEYETKLQEAYSNNNVEEFINGQGRSIFTALYPNSKDVTEFVSNPDAQKEIMERTWANASREVSVLIQQLNAEGKSVDFDGQNWFGYFEQYQINNILQNIKQVNGTFVGLDAHPSSSTTKALEQYQNWIQDKVESAERARNDGGMGM